MEYLSKHGYTIEKKAIISHAHDDVYFSRAGGLQETQHIFLKNNHLEEKFLNAAENVLIAESGFGTGLNFFATLQLWQKIHKPLHTAHLTYISFEKFPLPPSAIRKALAIYSELTPLIEKWLPFYPLPIEGVHEIRLGDVTLQLVLGDMKDWLAKLSFEADAWFLDGFAPAKNPDMWEDTTMHHIARHMKQGSTLATFTAVGNVRRALQEGGVQMQKVAGFGKKREMLLGVKS